MINFIQNNSKILLLMNKNINIFLIKKMKIINLNVFSWKIK